MTANFTEIVEGIVITGIQAGWTFAITSAATKIPTIGIPVAILLGIVGTCATLYLMNTVRFMVKDSS